MKKMTFRASIATSTAILLASNALAQTAPPAVDPQPAQTDSAAAAPGEDIVVTARRRGERLMGVPVVVTALSAATISKYNAITLEAIGSLTPSVIVANYKINGGGSLAIRGISTPASQVGFEQAVSVAIDGIQTSNGQIAQLGFFDLQQVEVLKGPQALFFGKNNTAGVISLTTAGPTQHLAAGIKTGYEFGGDELVTEGYVAGPLTDTLGARVAVRYRHLDGYLHNVARAIANPFYNAATGEPSSIAILPGATDDRPGEQEFLGRFTLKYEPSSNFKAVLHAFGAHSTDAGAGVYSQNIGPCTGPFPRVNGIADTTGECVPDNRVSSGNVPAAIAQTVRGTVNADGTPSGVLNAAIISLNIDGQVGPFAIASLSGFSRIHYRYYSGADQTTFSQLAVYEDESQRDLSQEIRITSRFKSPVNFVIGGFYQRTKRYDYLDNKLNDGNYNAATNRYDSFQTPTYEQGSTLSFFGQAIWNITPKLELAGGARWTHESKDFRKQNLYGIGAFDTSATLFPGSTEVGVLKGHFSDNNVSPEATLSWRPDENHTVFAAFRTGFKSGGFGMTNPLQKTTQIGAVDFESETAKGFELGARGIFLDHRLSLNGAIFAFTYKNLQVNTYDPVSIAYTINNAGELQQRGAEIEANFRATRMLTLHGALTYVHNRFKNFTGQCYSYTFPSGTTRATATPPPNCSFVSATALTLQQVYDGRASARSPDWSGNSGFDIDVPVGNLHAGFTGDALYSSKYYAADTLAPPTLQPGFWTFNASTSISGKDDKWKVSLIGRNLANKYYLLYAVDRTGGTGTPGSIGEQRGVVSRGRQVTLQAQIRF